MSTDKNVQSADNKKEKVSVLESIRRRTGLLVGIVGLALVIFILESLLSSGQTIFGGDDMMSVGSMNGKKIDRNDFAMRVENQLNLLRQQRQSQDIDDQTRGQVIDYVWNQYINDLVIQPQFDKLGIIVSEDEVYDRVVVNPLPSILQRLVDQKTGRIYDQLADANGNLDPMKWKQFVQTASGDQEGFVRDLEAGVKNTRQLEKYSSLIRKGLYVTSAESNFALKQGNTKVDFAYVMKRYDAVNDADVKVADSDIQKYYNDHSYEFKNPENTRKIEYVSFNVVPSPEDLATIEKDAQRAAAEFKGKNVSEDSAYIAQESENGAINIQNFNRKTMIVRDSSILTAEAGSVFGPYNEGAYFKVYKLQSSATIADSAKVRHILIGTTDIATGQVKRTKEAAKKSADSLLALIKDKKVTFDTLVKTVSDDMGSKDKGGDYGWFGEDKGFVEPFKNAGLMGTKGNISIVETQFGFHIIEVLDVAKTTHKTYKVAQIFKPIVPSDETNQKIFAQANEFAGKNNTPESFDKAVEADKLSKRLADNIRESDRELPGLDKAKEVVRWAFNANKGDISVFTLENKHIVVKLASIKPKGILPLEEVKDIVTERARLEKKKEMIAAEFASKAGSSKNIDEIASKMGLQPMKQEKFALSGHTVDGFHDDVLVGTLSGTKSGQTSKVMAGEVGVFMLSVSNSAEVNEGKDMKAVKLELEQEMASRSEYDVMNVLKELAEIEDHKSRID